MMMRDDFCAFILTHGRPNRVHTYKSLKRAGYTGKVYIVIDDEDKTADEYRAKFGDKVLQFCKKEIAEKIDEGDNFKDRRAIIYARNVCWELTNKVGCKYFVQLDDDYTAFFIRFNSQGKYFKSHRMKNLDKVFSIMLDFYIATPIKTIAMSQGGDWIGGFAADKMSLKRKAMNSFICSVDRPFGFYGRINEDVNIYTCESRKGNIFFTMMQVMLVQKTTQMSNGGMSDFYLDSGTYIKTFYSVMYAPSCVKVGILGDNASPHYRIHHKINWNKTAPKILQEKWKKAA